MIAGHSRATVAGRRAPRYQHDCRSRDLQRFDSHAGLPFINGTLKKKGLQSLVNYSHIRLSHEMTVKMLDDLKTLWIPVRDESRHLDRHRRSRNSPLEEGPLVDKADKDVINVEQQYLDGVITKR